VLIGREEPLSASPSGFQQAVALGYFLQSRCRSEKATVFTFFPALFLTFLAGAPPRSDRGLPPDDRSDFYSRAISFAPMAVEGLVSLYIVWIPLLSDVLSADLEKRLPRAPNPSL